MLKTYKLYRSLGKFFMQDLIIEDYIYVNNFKVLSYKVDSDVKNAEKNSDHYAIENELELPIISPT